MEYLYLRIVEDLKITAIVYANQCGRKMWKTNAKLSSFTNQSYCVVGNRDFDMSV